jgi:hypothetical protein
VAPEDVGPIDLSGLDGLAGSSGTGTWSGGGGGDGAAPKAKDWLFFPLPANEEQEEIARRLQEKDVFGVVVQGPPGTGKTHTIANIIGHAMATGQRVLVSAHTAEALSAIRDKPPPALRDLTIAVTHSDREGARQLEEAVSALAERAQSINPREARQRAEDLLRAIRREDGRVAEIDMELEQIARANLARGVGRARRWSASAPLLGGRSPANARRGSTPCAAGRGAGAACPGPAGNPRSGPLGRGLGEPGGRQVALRLLQGIWS